MSCVAEFTCVVVGEVMCCVMQSKICTVLY